MNDLRTVPTSTLSHRHESTQILQATHLALARQYAEDLGEMRAELIRRERDAAVQTWIAQRPEWEEA